MSFLLGQTKLSLLYTGVHIKLVTIFWGVPLYIIFCANMINPPYSAHCCEWLLLKFATVTHHGDSTR